VNIFRETVKANKFWVTVGIILLSSLLFSSSGSVVVSVRVTTTENRMTQEDHLLSDQVLPQPQSMTLPSQMAPPSSTPVATSTASSNGMAPPTPHTSGKALMMAWIYPGPPGCHAAQEYSDGRSIDTLKPQYFTLEDTGVLDLLTVANSGCNAYSSANARQIKQYSTHQYVTISGNATSMGALISDPTLEAQAIQTLLTFLKTVQFTGVELDFERWAQWTPEQYSGYKQFLTQLGNTLHHNGYKLMVDGPGDIALSGPSLAWNYADFNTLPVDYVVVLAYDWQYDLGVGTPVAPFSREVEVTKEVEGKITDINKIVIGIPSYGYHGATGSSTIIEDTYAQSQKYPGFASATRDSSSGEMMWTDAGVSYDYADTQTLVAKRATIERLGIHYISVWSLGGNPWFPGS
jgi:spore germination protein YaaH